MNSLDVHLLPQLIEPDRLRGSWTVVVDVLRATTTIAHALVAGARHVVPCESIDEAREVLRRQEAPRLLGGERGGLPIAGFDLGNSPAEYTPEVVGGAAIAMTTTNGTRAVRHGAAADQVLLAAFVNLTAIARVLADAPRVAVVCAGADGHVAREDVLLAGALCQRLCDALPRPPALNDEATLARDAWLAVAPGDLPAALRDSRGGRNLLRIGAERDIELAARLDTAPIVPRFDPTRGVILVHQER